ncbi:hypothetical protein D3C84_885310 [compost metagenome]
MGEHLGQIVEQVFIGIGVIDVDVEIGAGAAVDLFQDVFQYLAQRVFGLCGQSVLGARPARLGLSARRTLFVAPLDERLPQPVAGSMQRQVQAWWSRGRTQRGLVMGKVSESSKAVWQVDVHRASSHRA